MLNSDKLMMDVEERDDGTIVVNIARENHQKLEVNCFTIAGNKGFRYTVDGEDSTGLLFVTPEGVEVNTMEDEGDMLV